MISWVHIPWIFFLFLRWLGGSIGRKLGQVTELCFGGLRSDRYVSFCEHGGARDVRGGICAARSKQVLRRWAGLAGLRL